MDVVQVPEGYYGQITTLDGAPMPEGMFIAPVIADDKLATMLEAQTFIEQGGYRGPQETVLKPGSYRLNQLSLRRARSTRIRQRPSSRPARWAWSSPTSSSRASTATKRWCGSARPSMMPTRSRCRWCRRGCIGLWKEPLLPGAYYLNRHAYDVTLVDTRVQTWEYKGGYRRRIIDLSIDQQGNLQAGRSAPSTCRCPDRGRQRGLRQGRGLGHSAGTPRRGAGLARERAHRGGLGRRHRPDRAPHPDAADPLHRAQRGGLDRSAFRRRTATRSWATSSRPTRVLDFIENREAIEDTIEDQIKTEARKAGVEIKEIRLGEPAIPPEILIARLRQQLADQLGEAYKRETEAQKQRIETEQARATANEQPRLVEAQIAVQVADQREAERAALGRAERKYLEEIAQGQSAQANVLGQDRVAMLQALEKVLGTLEREPSLVTLMGKLVPNTVVTGSGLEGAAAILGDAMPWPAIPESILAIWNRVSNYPHPPEACLVNFYGADAKMGLHQDRDEEDFEAPVVSISLGDTALFRVGGTTRGGRRNR